MGGEDLEMCDVEELSSKYIHQLEVNRELLETIEVLRNKLLLAQASSNVMQGAMWNGSYHI